MKKVIQVIGGVLIAAAAVLIVINIYTGDIFSGLTDGAEKTETAEAHPKDGYEKAVLADPVFTYTGETAKKAGEAYTVFEEVRVTDSIDGYETTLKDAVTDGRIFVQDMAVLELGEDGMQEASAGIDMDSGVISIEKSGIYQVRISGMDSHNNAVKTEFLIAVNRKGA